MNLLLCLVNDVLDLKMIEEGVFKRQNEKFDPHETLNFVLNIFRQHAELQNSQLSLKVLSPTSKLDPLQQLLRICEPTEPTLPKHLFGDQIRLKQVLINLIKNALKVS